MNPFTKHFDATLLQALFAAACLFPQSASAQWEVKDNPLFTPWAKNINPENVWAEYPRPQMVRGEWQNLNGLWQLAKLNRYTNAVPADMPYEILVPFCVESALSGVKEHFENMAYRRTFTVPKEWTGKRILLHFEAVDWKTTVLVNGTKVGEHKGGYDPFTFDITDKLTDEGEQILAVKVNDPTNNEGNPRGKQSLNPGSIFYTCASGIWQTVWLEAVQPVYIDDLSITPNIDASLVSIALSIGGDKEKADTYTVEVLKDGQSVATAQGPATETLNIPIPDADLWTPDHPALYDLRISLRDTDGQTDEVTSYFGMRKISMEKDADKHLRLLLNNEFLFQMGPLDQGYWPDGIYTAPSDAAMLFDLQKTKQYGFNMVRKHIKVEPRRWYYYCDKLGLLVWQDMPSSNYGQSNPPTINNNQWKAELAAMVNHLKNHPSIVMWVLFNEAGGQHDTGSLVDYLRKLDPTRLINPASGWNHYPKGDIYDDHTYPAPGIVTPEYPNQAPVLGEYGGMVFAVKGHQWSSGNWGYSTMASMEEFAKTYTDYANTLAIQRIDHGLNAAVYTQITDVEIEQNGLMTYDRLPKGYIEAICAANQLAINGTPDRPITLLRTAEQGGETWKYTFKQPTANWTKATFDDSEWKEGKAGFGNGQPSNTIVGTSWTGADVWLRRELNLDITTDSLATLIEAGQEMVARIFYDEDFELYINGKKLASRTSYVTNYATIALPGALQLLQPDAPNTLALHCHQTTGGQYIDLGLSIHQPVQLLPDGIPTIAIEQPTPSTQQRRGIYDLSGRPLQRITRSGLYIIDGRKVRIGR